MQATYYIPVNNTLLEVQSPFLGGPKAVLIENHAGDNIAFDNGSDPVFLIPPGVTVPMNLSHLTYTLRFRSATNTTGSAKVTVYDNEVDTSRAPALQQLPGGISITGSVSIPSTVTISGSVDSSDAAAQGLLADLKTLINALNTLIGVTNANTGNTNTNVVSLQTLINTSNALDTDMRAYLAALQGLLPSSLTTLTFGGGWSEQTIGPLTTARQGFSIAVRRGALDGFLWVAYLVGGNRVYVEEMTYWGWQHAIVPPQFPVWLTYDESLPSGSSIIVGSDAAMTVTVRV